MHERNQFEIVKLVKNDHKQLEFLKQNLRNFYTNEIVIWEYGLDDFSTGLFFTKDLEKYIATQGMIPIYMNLQGKLILTAKSETSFLLPQYRGKGLFEDLYFHSIKVSEDDGAELIWGFTALTKVWRNKLKFEVYEGIIHETELQTSIIKEFNTTILSGLPPVKKVKKIFKAILAGVKSIRLQKINKEYSSKELDFKNISHQEEIIETYKTWQNNHADYLNIAATKDFLKWRISHNPKMNYKFIGIYKNENIIGLGILNDTAPKAYLVDFVVKDESQLEFCFNELMHFIKQTFYTTHIVYWANSLNKYNKAIHSLFKSYGAFCYKNNSMNFVVKRTKRASIDHIDLTKYCINGLWTEGFSI